MSDFDKSTFADFGKLVPGFDFLQNLTRQATAGAGQGPSKMPQLGHWVAPTMNVEVLEKRIAELKAVQFWLDQNATALKATIQALEVQKMTLATLHGMNVNMSEMAKAFSVKMPESAASPAAPAAEPDNGPLFSGLEVPDTRYQKSESTPAPDAAEPPARAAAGVDPMQWWGALTQQFQSIAASALKEVSDRHPLDAGKDMAQEVIKTTLKSGKSAVKPAAKTRVKPAFKTAAKAPVKAPVRAKAKPKAKAPARASAAVARKSPTRAR